jgi:hypothetical protein
VHALSWAATEGRDHPTTAHTPQPLNVKFEKLNARILKKEGDIRHISSILYNLGIFRNFLSTLKKS